MKFSKALQSGEYRRKWFLAKMRGVHGGHGSDLRALMALPRRALMFDPSVVGVEYAIVGGVATSLYMPERMTLDVDVLVAPEALTSARSNLEAAGWRKAARLVPEPGLGLEGESWRCSEQQLDLLWSPDAWARSAIADAANNDRRIVSLGYLVMMKMNAARGVDQGDLTRMLGFADETRLGQARQILRTYRSDLVEDFEQYVLIGRMEVDSQRRWEPPDRA